MVSSWEMGGATDTQEALAGLDGVMMRLLALFRFCSVGVY
jgi:hypothetical protein